MRFGHVCSQSIVFPPFRITTFLLLFVASSSQKKQQPTKPRRGRGRENKREEETRRVILSSHHYFILASPISSFQKMAQRTLLSPLVLIDCDDEFENDETNHKENSRLSWSGDVEFQNKRGDHSGILSSNRRGATREQLQEVCPYLYLCVLCVCVSM